MATEVMPETGESAASTAAELVERPLPTPTLDPLDPCPIPEKPGPRGCHPDYRPASSPVPIVPLEILGRDVCMEYYMKGSREQGGSVKEVEYCFSTSKKISTAHEIVGHLHGKLRKEEAFMASLAGSGIYNVSEGDFKNAAAYLRVTEHVALPVGPRDGPPDYSVMLRTALEEWMKYRNLEYELVEEDESGKEHLVYVEAPAFLLVPLLFLVNVAIESPPEQLKDAPLPKTGY